MKTIKKFIDVQPQVDKNPPENIALSKPTTSVKHVGMKWDSESKNLVPDVIPISAIKGFGKTWEEMQKSKK